MAVYLRAPPCLGAEVTWGWVCCCSVAKSRLTLCDSMDCSTPGSPVPRQLTPWNCSTMPHRPASAQNLGHVHGRALVLGCGHSAFTDLSCVLVYKKAHTKSFPSSQRGRKGSHHQSPPSPPHSHPTATLPPAPSPLALPPPPLCLHFRPHSEPPSPLGLPTVTTRFLAHS